MKRVSAAGLVLAFAACVAATSWAGAPPRADISATMSVSAVSAPDSAAMAHPDSTAARRYSVVVPTPSDSTLVSVLRRGNCVLLFRHAATDWGERDADLVDYADRASQRNLSPIGRAQADSIGRAVKRLGLKIGHVYASPMYRCRDTAEIAFGHADTTRYLFVKSKESGDARVKWLSTPLHDGANLVLVTHQDPYIPLFNLQRDQLKEADALLIQPMGEGQWKLLAQIAPADWARLAARYEK
jgi:phosphohistidine phosphatase SixA